jgi:hypothetical protein
MSELTAARIDELVRRLDVLAAHLGVSDLAALPRAATNPDGSPGSVAAGELIESAWGNAVATWLNRRTGCGLQQTGQSIPNGATVDVTWPVESYDTDGFHAAGSAVIQVPTNLDGVYAISAVIDAGGGLNGNSTLIIDVNSGFAIFPSYILSSNRNGAVSAVIACSAGTQIRVRMYNGHSTAATFTGRCWVARISKLTP